MGLLSWTKGQMLAATAFDQAEDYRHSSMAPARAAVVKEIIPFIDSFDDYEAPLDVQLQELATGPLARAFESAHLGRTVFMPSELWMLLFVAVALSGRYSRPELARVIGRLEDRAAERRRV